MKVDAKQKLKELLNGGFFHVFLSNTLIKLLGFVSSIVIIRLVSKNDYADYMYCLNLFSYISLMSGLGLSVALLKVCSTEEESTKNIAYLKASIAIGGGFQLIASIAVCLVAYFANIPFDGARPLIYLSVMLPVCSYVIELFQCYFRSQLKNKLFARLALFQTAAILGISICLVMLIGIKGAIFAQYITYASIIIICIFFIKDDLFSQNKNRLEKSQIKSFIVIGVSLMMANFFSMIMPSNEMLLINNVIRDEIITANYKVAVLIPSQLQFVTGSIMVYYFPIIARIRDGHEAFKKIKNIGFFVFGIIAVIVAIGMILTPFIIRYVYGEKYMDAISLSYIFWIVYGINAAIRMVPLNLLPAIGAMRFNAGLSLISCVFHFIVDYSLIKLFGIWGAAYALIIVYVLSSVAAWIYMRYYCNRKSMMV